MSHHQVGKVLLSAAIAAVLQGVAQSAVAQQEGIEEIVVTAQRREENLQEAPLAISALSADALTERGVTSLAGIANTSPSINFTPYPNSNNMLIMYMRGQGVADPNQITMDGSVGLYQDGFYISRPQLSTFDLADVERVEVLRGPQGTLYGRNTTGGAVNIISRKPTGEFDVRENLSFGNRGYFRSLTAIDLPSAGPLKAKLALLYSDLDGQVKNPGPGKDFGEEQQTAARLSLRYDNGGPLTGDYFFEWGDLNSTPNYYTNKGLVGVLPGYDTKQLDKPPSKAYRPFDLQTGNGTYQAHGLTLAWDFGAATLRSLTSYRDLSSRWTQNYADAFTNPASAAFTGAVGFSSLDDVDSQTFTQEFQLIGDIGDHVNYVAGLFYFNEDAKHAQTVDIAIPAFFYHQVNDRFVDAEATSKAAYVQFDWKPAALDDKLGITLGGRYTKDDRKASRDIVRNIDFVGVVGQEDGAKNDKSFSKFNWTAAVNYQFTDDINAYVRAATGYKAGGSSESGEIGTFGLTFKPEQVTTYELGLKSYLFDRRVRANFAAFASKFDDMQIGFNTNPNDLSIVLQQNAGKAEVNGLEVELLFQPIQNLALSIDWTLLDSKIKEVTVLPGTVFDPANNPASPYEVGDNIAKVFRLPYAPDNIINANLDWTFFAAGSNLFGLNLNYRWQDEQYLSAPTGPAIPNNKLYAVQPYGVLDARLTWTHELENKHSLKVALWGRNVTDERHPAHLIGQGAAVDLPDGFGGVTPAGLTFQSVMWAEKPRYGIDLIYGF